MFRSRFMKDRAVVCLAGGMAWLASSPALAQTAPVPQANSAITQVTIYPGSATVERTARLAPGTRALRFACLPANLPAQQLQALASEGVRIGELQVRTLPRAQAPECALPQQANALPLERQVAELDAEISATELALGYLRSWSAPDTTTAAGSASTQQRTGQSIGATADTLRQQALKQHQHLLDLHAQRKVLEPQLAAWTETQQRRDAATHNVTQVTVQVSASQTGTVRLRYQVAGPTWQPGYRAELDTASQHMRVERLALVQQSTGEDWNSVPITLSTGQPQRPSQAPLPQRWTVDLRPPAPPAMPAPAIAASAMMTRSAHAPVPLAESAPVQEVTTIDSAYATLFQTAQPMTVPSHGERISLSLGEQQIPVRLLTRTSPRRQTAAYLVAQFAPQPGLWPRASTTLYRDGAYTGTGMLDMPAAASNDAGAAQPAPVTGSLSFGQDDRVRVTAEPVERTTASAGLTGQRTEIRTVLRYRIDNLHRQAIDLQVLDAAPQAMNGDISVESKYDPAPTHLRWSEQPGVVVWEQQLPPGTSLPITAEHRIRHASDTPIVERP